MDMDTADGQTLLQTNPLLIGSRDSLQAIFFNKFIICNLL